MTALPTSDPSVLLSMDIGNEIKRRGRPRKADTPDPEPREVPSAPPTPVQIRAPDLSPVLRDPRDPAVETETEAYVDESGRLAFREVPRVNRSTVSTAVPTPAAPPVPSIDVVVVRSDRYSEADASRYAVLELILRLLYLVHGVECRGGRHAYLVKGLPEHLGDASALAGAGFDYESLAAAALSPAAQADPAAAARSVRDRMAAAGVLDAVGMGPLLRWFNKMCLNYEVFR